MLIKTTCLSIAFVTALILQTPAAPKNIILFIGDGMGISQLTAAKYTGGTLEIERMPIVGLATTHCTDQLVTDSAAGGTALATGQKTSSKTVSQTPDGKPMKTALEIAEEKGKATGLVCTSSITHATPASFSAHVASRYMEPEIAEQIAKKEIEVLFGGGLGFFIPQSETGSLRKDDQNELATLETWTTVITTKEEFNALGTPNRIAGLFATNKPPNLSEGRIPLADMTRKAIEILAQNRQGFFLMVEGSQIDWAGHANDAGQIIKEVLDFDAAVGIGLDFAEQDSDTLVIVTADHETGGFSVLDGSVESNTVTKTAFTTSGHSAAMVPVLAYGPGAEAFGGMQDNTDIGRQIINYIGTDNRGFFGRLLGLK